MKLEEPIARLEKLANTITERNSNQIILQAMIKRVEEAADSVYSNIVDVKDTIKLLSPAVNSLKTKIDKLATKTMTALPQMMANHQSYSAVTSANLPPMVDRALASILNLNPGTQIFPPNTPCSEIVNKIKLALTAIKWEDTPTRDVKMVLPLCNGGLIVEFDNENIAKWL
ncbi:hypothetical protein BDR04DRAFT_1160178 [Suillus decipiens]|nr:hypothetical protein BDR04DRAFT_1160178 [Suillus decipiens]